MQSHFAFHRLTTRALSVLAILCTGLVSAQVLPNYALFDGNGKKVSHKRFLRTLGEANVVLFGELHNNSIAHWLQLEVAKDLADRGPLVLGAETIEADDQATLDRYLKGEIDRGARYLARLWKNHPTDYAPLVDLARSAACPSDTATNVPRRYARARTGAGSRRSKPCRRTNVRDRPAVDRIRSRAAAIREHAHHDGRPRQSRHGEGPGAKDATMAHFLLMHLKEGGRLALQRHLPFRLPRRDRVVPAAGAPGA
ncbi:MAG: ChaN family lipoprotein [Flavobacteriales bacterium]